MAHDATMRKENLLAARGDFIYGLDRWPALQAEPFLKFFRSFSNDEEGHVCMLLAAKLRTLATEHSCAIRLKPDGCEPPGNEVALSLDVWCPETMNHVLRSAVQYHRCSNRNVDFVRGNDNVAGGWVGIVHLPPPLVPDHFDGQRRFRLQRRQGLARRDGGNQQPENNHYGDRDRHDHTGLKALLFGLVFPRRLLKKKRIITGAGHGSP